MVSSRGPFKGYISDLRRLGIKRSRIDSPVRYPTQLLGGGCGFNLKNISQNGFIFPKNFRGENETYLSRFTTGPVRCPTQSKDSNSEKTRSELRELEKN